MTAKEVSHDFVKLAHDEKDSTTLRKRGLPEGEEDVPAGVVGVDCGIGGNDSSNEAPKEDEGLKAFNPVKPVVCGCNGFEKLDVADLTFISITWAPT